MSKNLRNISVDGDKYIWVLPGNEAYSLGKRISVTLEGTSFSRLYIDPYSHELEIRPGSIMQAVRTARDRGWAPERNSGDMHLRINDCGQFERSYKCKQSDSKTAAPSSLWFSCRCCRRYVAL